MKKLLQSNNFWVVLITTLSFCFLLASYIPNFYEASISDLLPQDRIMIWGEHIYTYDYNVYLSKIRQGIEGRSLVVDKYDNHPQEKGALLQMLYLLSGKAGGIFHFDTALTFHLLRTLLSITWVFTIIYLNIYFLKKPVLYTIGILFSLFAASWPIFYKYQDQWSVGMHMAWWQEMDVLKRISYIPHYLLNYIIVAILAILLHLFSEQVIKKGKPQKIFILICIMVFLSFFIHPSGAILFIFSWILYHAIRTFWFRSYNKKQLMDVISYTIILSVVAAIPALYLEYVTSFYPWKSLVDFDKYTRYPVDVKEYILALGPVFFTGTLGLIIALKNKKEQLLSLVTWIIAAFAGIYLFKMFPYQSELRFVQTANHIPLAILSVYFIYQLTKALNNLLITGGANGRVPDSAQRSEHWREGNSRQNLSKLLVGSIIFIIAIPIILLGVVQSYFSIKAQMDFIHQRAVAIQPLVPYPPQVMYPLKDFWNGLKWLEENTNHKEDVVLSQFTAGNYIPAYSGDFVFFGHNPETPFYSDREQKVNQFFSGLMKDQDAHNFLKAENISYVFYGPQEKDRSAEDIKEYGFIRVVFSSNYVTIFKVIK